MTKIAEHAWGLRGRILDLRPDQLDLVAADIAKLPADHPAAPAREVRRAQKVLHLRAARARRQQIRRLYIRGRLQ